MRTLLRQKFKTPIYVCPGDTVQLTYKDPFGRSHVLAHKAVNEHHKFDTGIVFSLHDDELEDLGLTDALGGMFATEAKRD